MRYRTFVAVDVDRFGRDRLVGVQEQLAGVGEGIKWVEPHNLHMTLLFLGEIHEREVPSVCLAVEKICRARAAFPYTLAGIGAFPNLRRPRTLIAKISDGASDLIALHAALEPALLELGCYRREERPFTPHVTIGRVKRDAGGGELATALAKFDSWQGGQNRVREVKVLSSQTGRDGPAYTILSHSKLAGT